MRTRSSARNLFPPLDNPELTIRRRSRSDPTLLNNSEMAAEGNGDQPVPDLWTMEVLCQPSLYGRGGPIAPIAIQETNFGLKNDMIQQSIKMNEVTDDTLRLYIFPHSLTHHAIAWFDRLLRNSINTFEQMAKMFLGKYFPPSMVTKLRNEITSFNQRPDESLFEACECYKLSIDRCPNHNMLPVTQIDTFYNGLTLRHRDTINAAAGGTFMKRPTIGNTQNVYAGGAYQGNTITNPKEDLKGITTRSGTAYSLNLNSEPVNSPIIELVSSLFSTPKPNQRPSIPYSSRLHDRKLRDKANDQGEKFFQIFKDLNFNISFVDALKMILKFGPSIKSLLTNKDKLCKLTLRVVKESITFNLDQTSRNSANYNDMTVNRIDVIDMACEEYSQEVLSFSDVIAKVDAFLALEDDPTSPEVNQSYLDSEGDIPLLEAFLNDDPSLPPPNQGNYLPKVCKELKIYEAKSDKSLIDEPPKVELKDLPPHLEYVFLEGDDKLPVIIAKDLSVEEKTALITVLKSHKRAITWTLFDIKGIDPEFCTHKILMEEVFEPAVQNQRRVNPKIHDVIKQEVLKPLDARLIYLISDSPWVSPIHCVPKKGGFTVVKNKENELILTRLVTGWRICINYRENHIHMPYRTFANRRMPFGLCNAPGTFQRCMIAIFHDMIEKTMEVFMDDFLVFGNSFQSYLSHLEKMLKRCEDTHACLNWEKSHFMVKEGIVLGHKISKEGIKVDKAKVDVITKLPHPTTIKVLGQRQEKHFRPIHYASKTMTKAESNYTTTEKEMLAVVYAFEKLWSYLIMNKSIVYTDYSALKYLFAKKDSKARLLRWVLLLQEFTFKVIC
uniref:Reverse transcriptase domain-containing protein n=1 Tax=Tanacetum cinerariifolium TaxID=118510 RepID=A0A6L2LJA0_TANCI|nr:reverse transcriptase domain-containing protein [Tanacetum cinerariifolium]